MEKFGVVLNIKKMYKYFVMLILGLSLIFYGLMSFIIDQTQFKNVMTDEQIIERAKDLGMVELKENLETNHDKNQSN